MPLYHAYNALTNTRGDSLVGFRVQARIPNGGPIAPIYSDGNGTPIEVVSGIANTAITDDAGNYSFFIEANANYDLEYSTPEGVFVSATRNVPLFSGIKGDPGDTGSSDNTYTTLSALLASDGSRLSARLVPQAGETAPAGNFNYINGAWVRQAANGILVSKPATAALDQDADRRLNDQRLHSGTFVTAANSNGTTDNRLALQAMLDAGDCELLARTYAISDSLLLPQGRKVTIQPGTRLLWIGASPTQQEPRGFFRASGGNQIVVNSSRGGRAFFEAPTPMGFLHAIIGYAVSDVQYSGFDCTDCSIAYFDTARDVAAVDDYTRVVTPDMAGTSKPGGGTYQASDINVSQRIRQFDCDGRMRQTSLVGVGLQARYCYDVQVRGGTHTNYYAGVQWWGGDSDPSKQGALTNPRKAQNWTIDGCIGRNLVAGYWGSMGQNMLVQNTEVYGAQDVALDCEGGINVTFKNCKARDGHNGCLAMFNYNKNVRFENCTAEVTDKNYLLARVYNASQITALNLDVTYQGCSFTCFDTTGPGRIDTNSGPVRSYTLDGCTVVNALIDISGSNQVAIRADVRLPYKAPAAVNIISVRDTQGGGNFAPPMAKVSGCAIYSEVAQPAGSVGYYAIAGDPNSVPDHLIVNNSMRLPLDDNSQAGIRVVSAGRGSLPAAFTVRGNMTEGPISTVTSQGPAGLFDVSQNFNARGGVPPMG